MRRILPLLLALWAWNFAALARGDDAIASLDGVRVGQVSLEAPEGGLPRENLQPLLRVQQGEPLRLGDVRLDTALLLSSSSLFRR